MSSRRFPGVELTDWRSRVIDRHERLFPDAEPVRDLRGDRLASAGWPAVEDGWRDVIERLCRRLDAVAERSTGAVAIIGLDEKYAELRISVACLGLTAEEHEEIEDTISLAEARSGQTCGVCGRRGGVWSRGGWLTARCDEHGEGRPDPDLRDTVHVTTLWVSDAVVCRAERYHYELDRFVEVAKPLHREQD